MYIKRRKASTDPRVRSLLQKAVRRGDAEVVQWTARHLHNAGDKTWLRSRVVVITFEECWPMAKHLHITTQLNTRIAALFRVASAIKQKDAAGLGSLAYAFTVGHQGVLDVAPDHDAIRIVSEAIQRPKHFLDWAEVNSGSSSAMQVVSAARQYLAAATWPWDKACVLAGAYLAAVDGVPQCREANEATPNFPYWVALDKHTPQGKEVLRQLARERSISYRHLIWTSFYFESAKVNAIVDSPWWLAERTWRLKRAGLTADSARYLWEQLRADVAERLSSEGQQLRRDIEPKGPTQVSLF